MSKFDESSYSILQEWLDAFNKLNLVNKPRVITKAKWLDIQYEAFLLFKVDVNILEKIINNNWNIIDIFGCHYLTPMTRFDCMGLLLLKRQQDKIVEVSKDRIQLKTKNGIIKSFYKPFTDNEQSLIYKLENWQNCF